MDTGQDKEVFLCAEHVCCNKPLPICNKPLSIYCKPLPIWNKPLSICNKSLPFCNKPLLISNKPLPICNKPLPIWNKSLPICNKPLPICNKTLPIWNKPFSIRNMPLPICNKPLLICNRPLLIYKSLSIYCKTLPVCNKPLPVCNKPLPICIYLTSSSLTAEHGEQNLIHIYDYKVIYDFIIQSKASALPCPTAFPCYSVMSSLAKTHAQVTVLPEQVQSCVTIPVQMNFHQSLGFGTMVCFLVRVTAFTLLCFRCQCNS